MHSYCLIKRLQALKTIMQYVIKVTTYIKTGATTRVSVNYPQNQFFFSAETTKLM